MLGVSNSVTQVNLKTYDTNFCYEMFLHSKITEIHGNNNVGLSHTNQASLFYN